MTTAAEIQHLQEHGLYSKSNEHDACGLGFVAHIKGESAPRHRDRRASRFLQNLDYRGAVGATSSWATVQASYRQIPDQLTV